MIERRNPQKKLPSGEEWKKIINDADIANIFWVKFTIMLIFTIIWIKYLYIYINPFVLIKYKIDFMNYIN